MFVKKRFFWYSISGILLIIGLLPIFRYGISFDVDFTGGSIIQVQFDKDVAKDSVIKHLKEAKYSLSSVVTISKNEYRIKIKETEQNKENIKGKVFEELKKLSSFKEDEALFLSIEPVVGKELTNKTITALIIGLVVILIYIGFAFRQGSYILPSYFFGISGIIGIIHDGSITLGLFSLLSRYYNYDFSIPVAAALLTILGYSINDTIIIFDRIRENIIREGVEDFSALINNSILQTLPRSINTSLTTIIVIAAVLLWGSGTLIPFTFTLGVGILIGTFSSIFIAAPLLYDFYNLKKK